MGHETLLDPKSKTIVSVNLSNIVHTSPFSAYCLFGLWLQVPGLIPLSNNGAPSYLALVADIPIQRRLRSDYSKHLILPSRLADGPFLLAPTYGMTLLQSAPSPLIFRQHLKDILFSVHMFTNSSFEILNDDVSWQ